MSRPASSTTSSQEHVSTLRQQSASSDRLWHCCPRLIHRAVVDSTNAYLSRLLRTDATVETWTTVVSDHQTAGRGRYTRSWVDTPQTALLFSTVVRATTEQLGWVSLLAGIAMARVLRDHRARVKWPNDVIVDNKKVAGILTEHIAHEGDEHTVVLGVGLNIDTVPAEAGPYAGAISLRGALTRDRLLTAFLTTYRALIEKADPNSNPVPQEWVAEYTELLVGVGQLTTIQLASGETISAIVDSVDDDGALRVRRGGTHMTITCGDVALASSEIVAANSRERA
ncbi:MAG: biotin--[acetyl-CoA-carboxylase] ligase [Actinomycetaceae bacterium]|nr:biotin--[acetyl-CoA-carboxylase] ligase [Actinomycetaceae bacterium]